MLALNIVQSYSCLSTEGVVGPRWERKGVIHYQSHVGSVLGGRDETGEINIPTLSPPDPEIRGVPHVIGICRGDRIGL